MRGEEYRRPATDGSARPLPRSGGRGALVWRCARALTVRGGGRALQMRAFIDVIRASSGGFSLRFISYRSTFRLSYGPIQATLSRSNASFYTVLGLAQFFHCYVPYLKMCGQAQSYPPVSKRGYLGVMPDVANTSLFRRAYRGGGYAPPELTKTDHPVSVVHRVTPIVWPTSFGAYPAPR